ncbi:MAG: hypothetical protein R3C14_55170 [Caldilineaceae bacterium]
MLNDLVLPQAIPAHKVPGYKMPEDRANLLDWDFVSTQMALSLYYWLNTIHTDGRPHAVPVWGLWYKNRVHFEGSMKTAGRAIWYVIHESQYTCPVVSRLSLSKARHILLKMTISTAMNGINLIRASSPNTKWTKALRTGMFNRTKSWHGMGGRCSR